MTSAAPVQRSPPAMSDPESPVERRARWFADLVDLDDAARAEALADLACQDATLAADVGRMLTIDRQASGLLEGLRGEVAAAAERLLEDGTAASPPERLGPWLLGEHLGAGGMGEVWAAQRVEGGFTQSAAVKLVRAGMARREVVQRFAVERQLLARLDHPAIAKLLDGGVAPDGRPWFAMERVDGLPITRFAAERGLELEARIRLFLAVGEAVEFAHRSLVVHRDLKPSNIFVTPAGQPKLLDFGLAKLVEPSTSAAGGDSTRTDFRALTPAYAAPEQILGTPITTVADVYSLGVILYELLTGELPHRRRGPSPTTMVEDVEHETIERPSSRLRRLAAGAEPLRHELARRARRLEGDLDTILLKALAREPERRYASVAALAADLLAHLDGRPIAARPDTLGYRLGKFVRRHRVGVAAAGVVLVALVGGLTVSIRQTARANAAAAAARAEARRAERVKGFLVSVFEQADPTRTEGADMPARRVLAEGAVRLRTELREEPAVRAELYDAVARIQSSLGLLDESLATAMTAATERARLFGPHSLEHARSLTTVAGALFAQGKLDAAAARYTLATGIFEGAGDTNSTDYARALAGRGQVRMLRGDLHGARADAKQAHALLAAALGPDNAETLEQHSALAVIETEAGTFAEAAVIFRQILARLERTEGPDSARSLAVLLDLATALDTAGQSAEALPMFERVVAGRRKVYGQGHPAVADALVITSLRLSRAGRAEDALRGLAEARATYVPLDHPELGSVDNFTGLALADLGRFAEAESAFERAGARFAKDGGAENVLAATALGSEAYVVSEQGRVAEAVEMFESAGRQLRALGQFDNPRVLRMRINWAGALRRAGRLAEARQGVDAALAVAHEKLGDDHPRIADGEVELARLDLDEHGAAAAESARAHLVKAEAIAAKKPPSPAFSRNLAAARAELARAAH